MAHKIDDSSIFEDERSERIFIILEIGDGGASNHTPNLGAHFTKTSSQSLSAANLNIVNFDGAFHHLMGNYADDMSNGAIVIPSGGIWKIGASIS